MATTTPTRGLQDETKPEDIPPLTSIVPSIFVPLEDGLLDPFEPPKDRIERLQRILAEIDLQEKKVIDNMMWMIEREKRRIIMEARRVEDSDDPPPQAELGVDPVETDFLIKNMRAAPVPNTDYNVVEPQPPRHDLIPSDISHREDTTRQLLLVIENANREIAGYRTHMETAKAIYRDHLEREVLRDQEFAARPQKPSGRRA